MRLALKESDTVLEQPEHDRPRYDRIEHFRHGEVGHRHAVYGAVGVEPVVAHHEQREQDRRDSIRREDNRHVAFGWAGHFCFGAPLGRIEGQTAFRKLMQRFPNMRLAPGPISWRHNMGLRGLTALPVSL